MREDDIRRIVKELLLDRGSLKEGDAYEDETSFKDDLSMDSLDIVEFVMEIESSFELEIPDEDAEKVSTVGELITYLKERRA